MAEWAQSLLDSAITIAGKSGALMLVKRLGWCEDIWLNGEWLVPRIRLTHSWPEPHRYSAVLASFYILKPFSSFHVLSLTWPRPLFCLIIYLQDLPCCPTLMTLFQFNFYLQFCLPFLYLFSFFLLLCCLFCYHNCCWCFKWPLFLNWITLPQSISCRLDNDWDFQIGRKFLFNINTLLSPKVLAIGKSLLSIYFPEVHQNMTFV